MKCLKLFLYATPLLLAPGELLSQKHDYVWYLGGSGAGLDFSNCQPEVLTNMNSDGILFEGSVAISNSEGELQFYSNGLNVYNRGHEVMQNGELVGISNTQTQNCIAPWPGTDKYFLFSTDVQGGLVFNSSYPEAFGINYSVIDMSLQGGLGEVTEKFMALKDTSNCEKLCIVPHSNQQDFWLIGHEYGNDVFFVYLISESGISNEPLLQNIGPVIKTPPGLFESSQHDSIGELKASPNGQRLCFTTFYSGVTVLLDFNATTGTISNPQELQLGEVEGGYGVSFSPDNSKLYIACRDTAYVSDDVEYFGEILQFDLRDGESITVHFDLLEMIYPSLFFSTSHQGCCQKMPRLNHF